MYTQIFVVITGITFVFSLIASFVSASQLADLFSLLVMFFFTGVISASAWHARLEEEVISFDAYNWLCYRLPLLITVVVILLGLAWYNSLVVAVSAAGSVVYYRLGLLESASASN